MALFPGGSVVKNLPANARDAGDPGLIPEWGRSPGGGNGNPLQHSCQENPMNRGAWWATVHSAPKSQARLNTHACTCHTEPGSFPKSQFFASGGQSIGASASVWVLSMTIQGWFPLIQTCLISLQSRGLSRVFSNTTVQNHQFFGAQFPYGPALTSILTTGKNIALTRWNFIYIYKHICTHMVCCDSRGRKESDTTEQLNRTELKEKFLKRKIIMFWIKKANQLV